MLDVGITFDALSTSTNVIDGCSAKPSTGSSSVPVTNVRICPKETAPLLPASLLLNSQMQKTTYVLNFY